MLKPLGASSTLVGWMCVCPSTRSTTSFRARLMVLRIIRANPPPSVAGPATEGKEVIEARETLPLFFHRPALDQLVIVDGNALRLLVGELRLRTVGLAEPILRV